MGNAGLRGNREKLNAFEFSIRRDSCGGDVLSYETEGDVFTELRFDKIQMDESWRQKRIGTTIMAMILAIARYYQVRRITGTIYGDKFLWYWYAKLGFTIYDRNKLLTEFDINSSR
jgi:GNAT superfamily N-acetyltransferase